MINPCAGKRSTHQGRKVISGFPRSPDGLHQSHPPHSKKAHFIASSQTINRNNALESSRTHLGPRYLHLMSALFGAFSNADKPTVPYKCDSRRTMLPSAPSQHANYRHSPRGVKSRNLLRDLCRHQNHLVYAQEFRWASVSAKSTLR